MSFRLFVQKLLPLFLKGGGICVLAVCQLPFQCGDPGMLLLRFLESGFVGFLRRQKPPLQTGLLRLQLQKRCFRFLPGSEGKPLGKGFRLPVKPFDLGLKGQLSPFPCLDLSRPALASFFRFRNLFFQQPLSCKHHLCFLKLCGSRFQSIFKLLLLPEKPLF